MECDNEFDYEDINEEPEELTPQQRGARTKKDYTYRWVKCDVCNTMFKARNTGGVGRRFCGDDCSRRFHNQSHVPRESIDAYYDKARYQMVTDAFPDEDSRFPNTTRFGIMQLAYDICENVITSGSIVRNLKDKHLYKIDTTLLPRVKRTPSYVLKKALVRID